LKLHARKGRQKEAALIYRKGNREAVETTTVGWQVVPSKNPFIRVPKGKAAKWRGRSPPFSKGRSYLAKDTGMTMNFFIGKAKFLGMQAHRRGDEKQLRERRE